jgi:hypothetical protein
MDWDAVRVRRAMARFGAAVATVWRLRWYLVPLMHRIGGLAQRLAKRPTGLGVRDVAVGKVAAELVLLWRHC